jgi:hypothetical protein
VSEQRKRFINFRLDNGALDLRELAPDEPLPDGYELVGDFGGMGDLYSWADHARKTRDLLSRIHGERVEHDDEGGIKRITFNIADGKRGES